MVPGPMNAAVTSRPGPGRNLVYLGFLHPGAGIRIYFPGYAVGPVTRQVVTEAARLRQSDPPDVACGMRNVLGTSPPCSLRRSRRRGQLILRRGLCSRVAIPGGEGPGALGASTRPFLVVCHRVWGGAFNVLAEKLGELGVPRDVAGRSCASSRHRSP